MTGALSAGLAGRVAQRIAAFLASLALTFVGLTAVTFTISRLTKIDPVLAIVGDKARRRFTTRPSLPSASTSP